MQQQAHGGVPAHAHGSGAGGGSPRAPRTQEVAVIGGEDFIYSQMSGVSEDLFKGDQLGVFAGKWMYMHATACVPRTRERG